MAALFACRRDCGALFTTVASRSGHEPTCGRLRKRRLLARPPRGRAAGAGGADDGIADGRGDASDGDGAAPDIGGDDAGAGDDVFDDDLPAPADLPAADADDEVSDSSRSYASSDRGGDGDTYVTESSTTRSAGVGVGRDTDDDDDDDDDRYVYDDDGHGGPPAAGAAELVGVDDAVGADAVGAGDVGDLDDGRAGVPRGFTVPAVYEPLHPDTLASVPPLRLLEHNLRVRFDSGVSGRAHVMNLLSISERFDERFSLRAYDVAVKRCEEFNRVVHPDRLPRRGERMLNASAATERLKKEAGLFGAAQSFERVDVPFTDEERHRMPATARTDPHILRMHSYRAALSSLVQSPVLNKPGSLVAFPNDATLQVAAASGLVTEPLHAAATQEGNRRADFELRQRADFKDLEEKVLERGGTLFVQPHPFALLDDGVVVGDNAVANNRGLSVAGLYLTSLLLPEPVRKTKDGLVLVGMRVGVEKHKASGLAQTDARVRVEAATVTETIVHGIRELCSGPLLVMEGRDMPGLKMEWQTDNVYVVHAPWLWGISADMLGQVKLLHSLQWRHTIPFPLQPGSFRIEPGSYANVALADPPVAPEAGQRFARTSNAAAIYKAVRELDGAVRAGAPLTGPARLARCEVLRSAGIRCRPNEGTPPLMGLPISAVSGAALLRDYSGVDPASLFEPDRLHCLTLGMWKKIVTFVEWLIRNERSSEWNPALHNPRQFAHTANTQAHRDATAAAGRAWSTFVHNMNRCRGFNSGISEPRRHFRRGTDLLRVTYRGRDIVAILMQMTAAIGMKDTVIRNMHTRNAVLEALHLAMEVEARLSTVNGGVSVSDIDMCKQCWRALVSPAGPLVRAGFCTGKSWIYDPDFRGLNFPKNIYGYAIFDAALRKGHVSAMSTDTLELTLGNIKKDAARVSNWRESTMPADLCRTAQLRHFIRLQLKPAIATVLGSEPERSLGLTPRRNIGTGMRAANIRGLDNDRYGRVWASRSPEARTRVRALTRTFALSEINTPYFAHGPHGAAGAVDFVFSDDDVMLGTGMRLIVQTQDTVIYRGDMVRLAHGDERDLVSDSNADPGTQILAVVEEAFVYRDDQLIPVREAGNVGVGDNHSNEDVETNASALRDDGGSGSDASFGGGNSDLAHDDDDTTYDGDSESGDSANRHGGQELLRDRRAWRRGRICDWPTGWGFLLVHFCEPAPPPGTQNHASLLTSRLVPQNSGALSPTTPWAVRTLMDKRQLESYAVVRMESVLSKVWARPVFNPDATERDRLVTLRYT